MADERRVVRVLTTAEWARRSSSTTDLLSLLERQRAEHIRVAEAQRDFVASHLLAREVVAELAEVEVGVVQLSQDCPVCGSAGHGAPRVVVPEHRQIYASWSHGSSRIAAAAAFTPVGIDLETVSGQRSITDIVTHVLSPSEVALVDKATRPDLEFLSWWTRKEALVKVGAIGLDDFAATDLAGEMREWDGRWRDWLISSWHDEERDLVAALATRG